MIITEVGNWTVNDAVIVNPDGVTKIIVISDGMNYLVTDEDLSELMIAIAEHLGVERIEIANRD